MRAYKRIFLVTVLLALIFCLFSSCNSGPPPDPHVISSGGSCIIIYYPSIIVRCSATLTIENRGGAGDVFAAVKDDGHTQCKVIFMRAGETDKVSFSVSDDSFSYTVRPAQAADNLSCTVLPEPTITSPVDGGVYGLGEAVTFTCNAPRKSYGNLTYSWKSSLDGDLSSEKVFLKSDLSVGRHTITLSAKDADGRSTGRDSISIVIDDGVPDGELVWKLSTRSSVDSAPALDGEYLYSVINKSFIYLSVYCLNALTGEEIWEFETDSHIDIFTTYDASPAVVDGFVYAVVNDTMDSMLYCLDADTGEKQWEFETGHGSSSPAVSEGYVYIGSGYLYCLDGKTGEQIWVSEVSGHSNDTPAVSGGYIYSGTSSGKLYCFNAQSGETIWEFDAESSFSSSPAVANGYVYAACSNNRIYCLNAQNGEKSWEFNAGGIVSSTPAVSDGSIYFGSSDGKVYCLNAQTGDKVWECETGSSVTSSPAVTEDYVYIGSNDSFAYCINAETGNKVWKFQTDDSVKASPVLSDGYVFVGSTDESLYCLKAADEDTGSWPMFKGNAARTGAR